MAGIYLHIPFCKKACHYCDFHFSTVQKNRQLLVNSIAEEITLRKAEMQNSIIETVYFGGGTPSILTKQELEILWNSLHKNVDKTHLKEITLEANPDDITSEKLLFWKELGINRLSIGIQSFFDEHLQWMNRAHNAQHAKNCVKLAQDSGFENITIDLIFGLPKLTAEQWKINVQRAIALQVNHISAYGLTVEKGTALQKFIAAGKQQKPNDDAAAVHFEFMSNFLAENGFVQYEVSNFGKPNFFALHNTNYWKAMPYFGFGPSAHSFYRNTRKWNISNNLKYAKGVANQQLLFETEILTETDKFNEWVLTGLRTIWGLPKGELKAKFSEPIRKSFIAEAEKALIKGNLVEDESKWFIPQNRRLFSDGIASDLFYTRNKESIVRRNFNAL